MITPYQGGRIDGLALERELWRRGWTQRDLARAARLTEATVSYAINGRRITARTLRSILRALADNPPAADALLSAEPAS